MRVTNNPSPKPPNPNQKRNQLIALGIAVFFLLIFIVSEYNRGRTARELEEGMSDTMREYCSLLRQQGETSENCERYK